MDEQEGLKRIQAFLAERNQSTETITASRLRQLQNIDKAIQQRLEAIAVAKESLKTNTITLQAIAADSGISRKTFYNNDLLKEYVESHTKMNGESTRSIRASEYDYLKKRLETLTADLQMMHIRDIKAETSRYNAEQLEKTIEAKDKQIENLTKMYEAAVDEVTKLRKENYNSNVVPLRQNYDDRS